MILKMSRIVIALIIVLIFELAIDLPDRTSMVGSVTEVNQFIFSVLLSIKSVVKTCKTNLDLVLIFLQDRTLSRGIEFQ